MKVLVIPDLFPKFEGDVQGIFILDYLKAIKNDCSISVLFLRVTGKKGLHIETTDSATIYRYCLSEKKIPSFLKPLAYFLWFIKGFQLGKKFTTVDIIHAHGTILSGTLAYLLSKKFKKPFIIS